jgi:lipopolysaccharide/colanic/teichoic acid biosynthesis glycosyltransferase
VVMDTLRERNASMLRTGPERETSGHNVESAHASVNGAFTATTLSDEDAGLDRTVLAPVDCEDQSRFSKDYRNPLFPQKSVSYAPLKRLFDFVFAVGVLFLISPLMILIACIIKATDRGPIFFKQVRVGKGGRLFHCYKFRSMCIDAEEKKQELMHLNEASGPVFKIKADPRVTPIGAYIRKMSIDELPQFFNVIRGEMSTVGPRPPIPSEVEQYGEHERKRLAVHPGITCLWQIGGRSNITFERWVELDIEYIESMSFGKDVAIILKTVPAVLKSSGAH